MTPCGHPATHRVVWSARYNHPNHGIVCLRLENRGRQMTATIARRAFIAAIGGAAAWPLVAGAQQPALPVIGLLQIGAPSSWDFAGFRQGLKDTGYVEGQNLAVEYQWANDDPDRLPQLATLAKTIGIVRVSRWMATVT